MYRFFHSKCMKSNSHYRMCVTCSSAHLQKQTNKTKKWRCEFCTHTLTKVQKKTVGKQEANARPLLYNTGIFPVCSRSFETLPIGRPHSNACFDPVFGSDRITQLLFGFSEQIAQNREKNTEDYTHVVTILVWMLHVFDLNIKWHCLMSSWCPLNSKQIV